MSRRRDGRASRTWRTPRIWRTSRAWRTPRTVRFAALLGVALAVACGAEGGATGSREGGAEGGGAATSATPAPRFDGDSARALIRAQVAFGPRVPGTAAHDAQLAWMAEYLRARADTVEVQRFTLPREGAEPLPLANVFARFRPEASDRILLVAHWDTRPIADQEPDEAARSQPIPGANDGGSGVAVLMELADVLSSHSPPIGVDLLFTDGEDYATPAEPEKDMYLGAEYFAAHQPRGYPPLYAVLVDMVGDESPEFFVESNSAQMAPEVVERVWRMASELGYGPLFPKQVGVSVTDDHLALNRAGIRTADVIDFEYGPANRYWHTHEDTYEHTSARGLQAVGQVLTALIFQGG